MNKITLFVLEFINSCFSKTKCNTPHIWALQKCMRLSDLTQVVPFIVRVIKSRRMRWAGHVARMGEERGCIGSCWGNRREGDHWGDLSVNGWIILG